MECCIYRGTKEIGGSCVELSFGGERIVLDIGLPLDSKVADPSMVPDIKGIFKKTDDLKGVVISHYHQDHAGLLPFIDRNIPIAIGKVSKDIINTSSFFMKRKYNLEETIDLENRKSIYLGKFKITPFIVDHSAYDAYAILVEAGGKKLLYTGDLRAHGRKAALFDYLLKNLPQGIDTMLMEGTCLGRLDENATFTTEQELEEKFISSYLNSKGIALVVASGQNIDRIVTIYRAAKRTGRQLIIDPYIAEILKATGNDKIPQFHWDNMKVFIPDWERSHLASEKRFDLVESYKKNRLYLEHIAEQAHKSVIMFRPSMMGDFDKISEITANATAIYSMWEGYLQEDAGVLLREFFDKYKIPMSYIHTSGHADIPTLKKLSEAVNPGKIVPIHSFEGDKFPELFKNVDIKGDGEVWKV